MTTTAQTPATTPAQPPTSPRRRAGLFVGLATLDLVQRVDALPGPDDKATATWQELAAGGPALNAAVVFAALGGDATLVTRVGAGPLGRLVADDLRRQNVRLIDLADAGYTPAVSAIAVDAGTGARQIISTDAGASTPPAPDDPRLNNLAHETVDIVLIDGHHPDLAHAVLDAVTEARALGPTDTLGVTGAPTETDPLTETDTHDETDTLTEADAHGETDTLTEAGTHSETSATGETDTRIEADTHGKTDTLTEADADGEASAPADTDTHRHGLDQPPGPFRRPTRPPVVLDAGRWKPPMARLLPRCTDIICSAAFRLETPATTADDPDALLDALLATGARFAAISNGAEPIRWRHAHGTGQLEVRPTQVVDTLAAGDALHGAYAWGLATRLADSPIDPADPIDQRPQALSTAATIATRSTTHRGTRSWLADLRETHRPGDSP